MNKIRRMGLKNHLGGISSVCLDGNVSGLK